MPDGEVHAIVLSGGGAKGAYEVGVIKALLEKGTALEPTVFTGTSVGSYNAAFMVSKDQSTGSEAVSELERVWLDRISSASEFDENGVFRLRGDPFRVMNPLARDPVRNLRDLADDGAFFARDWAERACHLFSTGEGLARRFLELIDLSSLVSNEPLLALIRNTIHAEEVLESRKALRMATTCWDTGTLRVFRNQPGQVSVLDYERRLDGENIHAAVAASAAIPGLFPPVRIGSERFVDGGVVMNTPLKSAIRAGASTLHVVYLDPASEERESDHPSNTLDTLNRLFVQMQGVNTSRDIEEVKRINHLLLIQGHLGEAEKQLGKRPVTAAGAAGKGAVKRREPGGMHEHLERMRTRLDAEMDKPRKDLRLLTVHRYRPRCSMGGLLGLLNFARDRVRKLIEEGYQDTRTHSCSESECVIPD